MHTMRQFERADYEVHTVRLAEMTREKVVAALKRNSAMFDRSASSCCIASTQWGLHSSTHCSCIAFT